MPSKLQQTGSSKFLSSFEDRINALDLKTPASIDDDIWSVNVTDRGVSIVDFSVFDKESFCSGQLILATSL